MIRACVYCPSGPMGANTMIEPPTWDGLMLPDLPARHDDISCRCAIEKTLVPSELKRHAKSVDIKKFPEWVFLDVPIRALPAS